MIAGKNSFDAGDVESGPYVLTVIGYLLMAFGGFLGGSVVFVHGMRVLNLVDEPARRAASPMPTLKRKRPRAC